jgi:urease accessory protein
MHELPLNQSWRARLDLGFERPAARTILAHRRHQGPLLVQRLLYPEGDAGACHVHVIHPPGGVAGGDDLTLDVHAGPGSRVLLTTPAAGKFYRKGPAGGARVRQILRADDASLEWLPQENIFYPDAEASVSSTVRLTGAARFVGWELICLGLPANGASLQGGAVRLRFEIWRDGRATLIENLHLAGPTLQSRFALAGFPVFGTLLAAPAGERELEAARSCVRDCAGPDVACTLVDGILACRSLVGATGLLRSIFERLWRALRPMVIGSVPTTPRIWAT